MFVEKICTRVKGDYELDAEIYFPDENRQFPGILLNHGFLSAKEEYGDLPQNLAKAGYVVMTYDYRGHGKSTGDKGYFTFSSHLQDTEAALKTLISQVKVIPERIAVIGHSLGSVAATRLITESPEGKKCKTCILLAPPRKFEDSIHPVELNAYRLVSTLAWPLLLFSGKHLYLPYKFGVKDIFISKDAIARAEQLNFLQNKMSVNNYYYMIKQIDHEKSASQVEIPTLVVVAKGDTLVPNQFSRKVYDALKTPDKKFLEIDNSGHSLMTDASSYDVEKAILDWLAEKL